MLLFVIINSKAQEKKGVSVKINGFVWAESIYDTRQTVSAREGDVLIFTAPELLDANGNDINARPSFNIFSVHSRLQTKIKAPDFLNAKVSGLIEGDFVATSNDRIGLFRLRHAMVKLNWDKTELLLGNYWSPMFSLYAFPQIVSWGGAIPFHPLSRNPQVRLTYKATENSQFSITALTQLDFKSTGPDGTSSKYIRNSGIPEMNISYVTGVKSNFLIGIVAGYKVLKPQLSFENTANEIIKSEESIGSFQFNVFSRIKAKKNTFRLGAIYGQNMYNFVMVGGYGVSGFNDNGEAEYTNLRTGSYWLDYEKSLLEKKIILGFYGGYLKNYGADKVIVGDAYVRGEHVDHTFRVSSRMIYGIGPVKLRGEVVYNNTAYGIPDTKYVVKDIENIGHFRFVLATSLHF